MGLVKEGNSHCWGVLHIGNGGSRCTVLCMKVDLDIPKFGLMELSDDLITPVG